MGVIEREGERVSAAASGPRDEEACGSVLVGDRLCAGCHFNLTGQPVMKDRRSGLVLVRCPECALPAALQEYPLLGKWSARLGYVLAAGWLAALLVLLMVTGGVTYGIAASTHEAVASPYWGHVNAAYTEHSAALTAAATAAGAPTTNVWAQTQTWWQGLDKRRLFREFGGAGALAWWRTAELLGWAFLLVPMGAVWAVALPHARLRHWAGVVALLGVPWAIIWTMTRHRSGMWWGANWYAEVGERTFWLVMPALLAGEVAMLTAGFAVGRRLARGLVVLMLPPRLRGPLAFLWLADGKRLPRAGAGR